MIDIPLPPPSVLHSPVSLTAAQFYRRTGALFLLTALTLGMIWLIALPIRRSERAQIEAEASFKHQQEQLTELQALRTTYGDATLEAVLQSVPDPFALGRFFAALETLASAHGVTTQYNFSSLKKETAKPTPGQYEIAADFLGTVANLTNFLGALENGHYIVEIQTMKFDTTDPDHGQLALEFTLYGKS